MLLSVRVGQQKKLVSNTTSPLLIVIINTSNGIEWCRAHVFVDIQGFVRPKLMKQRPVWIILIKISLHTQIDNYTINNLEIDTVEVLIVKDNFDVFRLVYSHN